MPEVSCIIGVKDMRMELGRYRLTVIRSLVGLVKCFSPLLGPVNLHSNN